MSSEKSPRHSSLADRENDRERFYKKFFSINAREGYDIGEGEDSRHVKGWYERFPLLTQQQIDEIVYTHEQKATESKLVNFSGAILEGDLSRATVKVRRQRVKQLKYEVRDSKKELSHEKSQLKREKKLFKKVKKQLKSIRKGVFP